MSAAQTAFDESDKALKLVKADAKNKQELEKAKADAESALAKAREELSKERTEFVNGELLTIKNDKSPLFKLATATPSGRTSANTQSQIKAEQGEPETRLKPELPIADPEVIARATAPSLDSAKASVLLSNVDLTNDKVRTGLIEKINATGVVNLTAAELTFKSKQLQLDGVTNTFTAGVIADVHVATETNEPSGSYILTGSGTLHHTKIGGAEGLESLTVEGQELRVDSTAAEHCKSPERGGSKRG